jgi:hypothetical protein
MFHIYRPGEWEKLMIKMLTTTAAYKRGTKHLANIRSAASKKKCGVAVASKPQLPRDPGQSELVVSRAANFD